MLCNITDALSFFFPFFLSLSSIKYTEFVCDHACFCVYVYLWIYRLHMKENMHLLCFWSWLTKLNIMSSNYIQLPSDPMSLFLVAE
jgi:hypothetical protein